LAQNGIIPALTIPLGKALERFDRRSGQHGVPIIGRKLRVFVLDSLEYGFQELED
jgi:hypothetical protein